MRIVHIIEAIGSWPAPTTLRLLREIVEADEEAEHAVIALGPKPLAAWIERAGLRVSAALTAPARSVWRSAWALRRGGRSLPDAEVYHGWSLSGTALADSAATRAARPAAGVGFIPYAPATGRAERCAIRRLARAKGPALLALDHSIQERLIVAGLPPARVRVLHPGIAAPRRVAEDRMAMRLRWGVTDRATRIVAALGDPPRGTDAMAALLGVGFAAAAGRPVRLLISPAAADLHRARHIARSTGRERLLIIDSAADEPWRVLHACDMALVLTGGLSAAWAMAAALPIVAPSAPGIAEHLVDGHSALLARRASAGDLAPRICRLYDDAPLAGRLAETARRTAEQRFTHARLIRQLHEVYHCLLEGGGDLAETSPVAPGAGAGRSAARSLSDASHGREARRSAR